MTKSGMRKIKSLPPLLMTLLAMSVSAQDLTPPPGVSFMVSATALTGESQCNHGDELGLDVLLRLRLSTSTRPLFILVMSRPAIVLQPMGNALHVSSEKYVWRNAGRSGDDTSKSPGPPKLCDVVRCDWVELPPHSSLEWEQCDVSPRSIELRSQTVFVRVDSVDSAREVMSNVYTVTGRPPGWR